MESIQVGYVSLGSIGKTYYHKYLIWGCIRLAQKIVKFYTIFARF